MDHDVASYDEPYRTSQPYDDETTEIVPKIPARRKAPVARVPAPPKVRAVARVMMPAPIERVPAPPRIATPSSAGTPARPRPVAPAPAPVRRRWSARTLAMFGAGMGTASGMVVAMAVLLGLAMSVPSGGGAPSIAVPSAPADVGWVDMVTAVGTTIVTGKPVVERRVVRAPVATKMKPPVGLIPTVARVEAPVVSAPPVLPAATKPTPRKPSRSKPRPLPVESPVVVVVEAAPAVAEFDPTLVVDALPGAEIDLLAGDDGLGEVVAYAPSKAQLVDLGVTPESPDLEALSELDLLDTRVVRIAVEGGATSVEVDGRPIGTTPVAVDLEPGSHEVTLYAGEKATTFELEATADIGEWCFEVRGRSFGQVRCD